MSKSRMLWRASRVTLLTALGRGFLVCALVIWSACAPSQSKGGKAPEPGEPLNVVVVMVDTLRADHLGAYGYHRKTSPSLDEFAASAILFEDNRSQASCTFPSANSLLTSRYPIQFLGQPEGGMGIPEGIESLPEILQRQGYTTVALSASPIVRKNPSRFNPGGGFDRGFDYFGEGCIWKSADCLHDRLKEQLKELEQPFFLYLHFMDPHGPYRPPPQHRRRFADEEFRGPDFVKDGDPNPIAEAIYGTGPVLRWRDEDMDHLVDLYDDEIAYYDDLFPRLLGSLERAGALTNTLIAVVSDHGEEFFEHGHVKHCRAPFDTLVKTPFILLLPGGPTGLRVRGAVQNLDLVPTVVDYLGVEGAGPFDGVSLRSRIDSAIRGRSGPPADEAPPLAFSAQGDWRSVFDGRYKLLFHQRRTVFQLFDVSSDPGEKEELSRQRPEDYRRLRRVLLQWLIDTEGGVANEAALAKADESTERLRALGYVQ